MDGRYSPPSSSPTPALILSLALWPFGNIYELGISVPLGLSRNDTGGVLGGGGGRPGDRHETFPLSCLSESVWPQTHTLPPPSISTPKTSSGVSVLYCRPRALLSSGGPAAEEKNARGVGMDSTDGLEGSPYQSYTPRSTAPKPNKSLPIAGNET